MERYFNIAGPCIPGEHCMLPALDRIPEVRRLVSRRQYFVIHAPCQTGKTTAVQALVDEINAKGDMVAIYCTLETLQNATDIDNAVPKLKRLLLRSANAVSALAGWRDLGAGFVLAFRRLDAAERRLVASWAVSMKRRRTRSSRTAAAWRG